MEKQEYTRNVVIARSTRRYLANRDHMRTSSPRQCKQSTSTTAYCKCTTMAILWQANLASQAQVAPSVLLHQDGAVDARPAESREHSQVTVLAAVQTYGTRPSALSATEIERPSLSTQ